jgi:hypothetical protein
MISCAVALFCVEYARSILSLRKGVPIYLVLTADDIPPNIQPCQRPLANNGKNMCAKGPSLPPVLVESSKDNLLVDAALRKETT